MQRLKLILLAVSFVGALCFTFIKADRETEKLPPLIPRKLLFGNPEKAGGLISPDGKKLAYLAPDAHQVLNVWVRDLENKGGEKDRQITHDQKRGIRQYLWQMDNSSILYIQDRDGDENWHLYQTDLTNQSTKDLTPFEGVKVEIIDTDIKNPHEIVVQMNKRDPTLYDVYRINLETGNIDLDTENPGGVIGWMTDHDQQIRVAQALLDDGSLVIKVRDHKDDPWRDWLVIPQEEVGIVQDFSADNQSLYVMSSVDTNTARLLKIDLKTGKQVVIAEDPNYDLSTLILHPTTHELEAVGVERKKYERIPLNPQIEADFNYLSEHLKSSFGITSRDLDNQKWLVATTSDVHPSHYYLYDRGNQTLKFLFTTQPALEKYSFNSMEPIQFQARDGMTLHGYLTFPEGLKPENLPTVLLVHGGPWARTSWGMDSQVQWLANRGYAVLQIDFRGSTGYGKGYLNAGNKEWGNKMHDDLLDGKEWMIKQGYADPKKVAIMGGSYGGYATLVGLTFTPDEFCCGVDIVGPSNLITLLQTFPPYWKPLKAKMDVRVGNLETEEEFLKSRSPFYKVDQIKKPLFIAQGANDPRVKQSESDQIVGAMRQKNIPVEYLLFADEGHGFVRPENRLRYYAAVENFLSQHLGGRIEAATKEDNWEAFKK